LLEGESSPERENAKIFSHGVRTLFSRVLLLLFSLPGYSAVWVVGFQREGNNFQQQLDLDP